MKNILLSIVCGLLVSCNQSTEKPDFIHVVTTEQKAWQEENTTTNAINNGGIQEVNIDLSNTRQEIEGFGACFNELGWTSLSQLSESDRKFIMEELFSTKKGARFSICRMPIGANDFSRDWYSYNEVDCDFNMYNFSINNDYATLIPFIKEAQKYNPDLKIWASPWCPPTWMKHNRHYASSFNENWDMKYRNGLPADRIGHEGTDMFIMKPEYLKAYALYFKKFIQAYKDAGISIFGVMPQNEFNSPQVFPSCCWTAKGLSTLIGKYLGPAMEEENVDILMGTMERPNHLLVDSVMKDPEAGKYIKGAGFQWAGQKAIGKINELYPNLKLYQTEQECGDGKNDWKGLLHSWKLLKHFINNGVSVYDYWNISLKQGGISRWGWAQNSLVVVNEENHSYKFTIEYYLMKHISHFVEKGAFFIKTKGTASDNCLVFRNPDNSIIVLTVENTGKNYNLRIKYNGKSKDVSIKANSINTIKIPA